MATKLKIIEYGFTSEDKSTVRIYTEDGGMIDARRCPIDQTGNRVLYCTREGVFLSLSRFGLREVQQNESARYLAGGHRGGSRYPKLSYFGNKACHILMWETWVGTRTPGKEIDHINGDKMDCRLCNLEEVTPAENRKRAVILRARRMIARQDRRPELLPENMKPEELLELFNMYNVAGDVA